MPIEHKHGATILTGDSIGFYRLCALKTALGLELKGIKMYRGSVMKVLRREFGLKGSKAKMHAWLCEEVERLKPLQEHRTVENGREIREVEGKEVH